MPKNPTKSSPSKRPAKLSIARLIHPYWKALTLAFLAVLGETFSDVLDPWPIKVVIDNVLQSKNLPGWLAGYVTSAFGQDKLAVLNFAVVAIAAIAVIGTFVSRTPSGGTMPAISRFAGAYSAAFISNAWEPRSQNSTADALERGSTALLSSVGWHVFEEFWPDIKKALHHGH